MKFSEAKNRLSAIACDKCYSIKYEETYYRSGTIETECAVYIDGFGLFSGEKWEEALTKLEFKIAPSAEPIFEQRPE
jgi:hypothetical protein